MYYKFSHSWLRELKNLVSIFHIVSLALAYTLCCCCCCYSFNIMADRDQGDSVGSNVDMLPVTSPSPTLSFPYDVDQESSRIELAKIIVMHEYPIKMVEHEGFKNFVKTLNPCFKLCQETQLRTIFWSCTMVWRRLWYAPLRVVKVELQSQQICGHLHIRRKDLWLLVHTILTTIGSYKAESLGTNLKFSELLL